MSFCRMDDDCYILCYESEGGRVDIIVQQSIANPDYSIPAGLTDLEEMTYAVKHFSKLYMPWDNPRAGAKYWNLPTSQAEEILKSLRADGVRFPDSVFDEVKKLEAEYALYEPTVGDVIEAMPL